MRHRSSLCSLLVAFAVACGGAQDPESLSSGTSGSPGSPPSPIQTPTPTPTPMPMPTPTPTPTPMPTPTPTPMPTPTPTTGYLHTKGASLLDSTNKVVRLTGLSWFGLETSTYAPHGLWSRALGSVLDQVKSLGYNSVRVPFSNQLFDAGSAPNSIDYALNPDLAGLDGIHLLDKVIEAAGARGLRVVLDRHRPDSGAQSALWYTAQYPEARWISDWTMLATRYKGNATVVGFDLHNEPHGSATWGDGSLQTDWRLAAERAGNAVLAVNPDLLIIVEGIEVAQGQPYWWGGNLRNAGASPVRLNVANRLVYSIHDYPASVYAQPWFTAPTFPQSLDDEWTATWGYLVDQDVAPVWIGEFGTKNVTAIDQAWLTELAGFIGKKKMSFAFWCLNPDSGDTGGLLADDWKTVNADKQSVLAPLLSPLL